VYWHDGLDYAPDVVRLALLLVNKICKKYKVHFISARNLEAYFPYASNLRRRITLNIKEAHFADFLRTYLITKYGGVWIDASCFVIRDLSECMDSILEKHGFFLFKANNFRDRQIMNWFLAAKSGAGPFCDLMKIWLDFACREREKPLNLTFYPERHCAEHLIGPRETDSRALKEIERHGFFPYFFYHYIWNEICRKNKAYQERFDALPVVSIPVIKFDRRKFIGRQYFRNYGEDLILDEAAVESEELFPMSVRRTILDLLRCP